MSEQPTQKLCECGCGRPTAMIMRNNSYWGMVKGEYRRYIRGHAHPRKLVWGPELWSVEDRGFATPCWIWLKASDKSGYGVFRITENKHSGSGLAHKHSWELLQGRSVLPEMELDHLCRNRSCVRPDHLEEISHRENIRRGANAKLTYETAEEIRSLRETGLTHRAIAERYGVCTRTVSRVLSRKQWD